MSLGTRDDVNEAGSGPKPAEGVDRPFEGVETPRGQASLYRTNLRRTANQIVNWHAPRIVLPALWLSHHAGLFHLLQGSPVPSHSWFRINFLGQDSANTQPSARLTKLMED